MIQTGLDVLLHQKDRLLKNYRIEWITHPAAVTSDLTVGISACPVK